MQLHIRQHPSCFDDINLHPIINNQLIQLAKCKNSPHLIIYGPESCGKSTRIEAYLKVRYIEFSCVENRTELENLSKVAVKKITADEQELEVNVIESPIHIQLDLKQVKRYFDKKIICALTKQYSENYMLQSTSNTIGVRTIWVQNCQLLSKMAQQALRRMMEKYSGTIRFILSTTSIDLMIDPLQSRSMLIRIPSPSLEDLKLLAIDFDNENLNDSVVERIYNVSNGHIVNWFGLIEVYFKCGQIPSHTKWQMAVNDIATLIVTGFPSEYEENVTKIRSHAYHLVLGKIDVGLIFCELIKCLKLKSELFRKYSLLVTQWAGECELRSVMSKQNIDYLNKDAIHIDAFVTKCISLSMER